ncbi:uncharacterized protein LOC129294862 [Prosopis cineraria]|uniref:uncharacterized protein LOC129294862 n=1 Tax=Prosopis cineraria TaxID=364024 RepID=UPI00240FEEFC|nr:uncharacterized protein LOC129294862 [Prosopis cineraria]
MDIIAGRLETIQNEISEAENQKLECEQMLGLFWEHPPALDPEDVGRRMQFLRDHIRALEERRRVLIRERELLLIRAASIIRGRPGGNN